MNLLRQLWKHRKRRGLDDWAVIAFRAGLVAALVVAGLLIKSCLP